MNYFNKKNLIIIAIAVLLIINVAAISTVLFLTYKKPALAQKQSIESIRGARKNLKLNADQKDAFEVFQQDYQKKTKEVFVEMHQKRVMMMDEFSKEDPDSMLLYELAKQTGNLHQELKMLTINHLLDLKGICTKEQFRYLEGMFRQKLMNDESVMHRPFDNKARKYRNRRSAQPQRER